MSRRYRLLLILINTLERVPIDYHLVGCSHPSDKYTAVRVGEHPNANYFIVSDKGISYTVSNMSSFVEEFKMRTIVSSVMAAASIEVGQ
nr:MAG TPA: hypothetical protein [Caudoviricetes sp.]